ncbi:sensor histidine kinase [Cytobacillus firmus]|uniref:sensor histidine kinase n=1 Tax=Cytobacillus firmus TaxID=1399 RepID=UPI0018CD782D|nr:HAMP domain-containing sensor histidine kinase [Cytobacillus firmus]MED1904470.1 HAMP domain-containing sensor histidine kinase [Cytobacillus firmus]
MMWTMFILLIIIVLGLLYDRISLNKQIKKIKGDLDESISKNSVTHLRIHYSSTPLISLIDSINRFMEKYHHNREKTNFLEIERKKMITNISHDIRTPLTSILGYMEVIYRENSRMTEEERLKYLELVYQKAQKLTAITESFFELAQLEAGEIDIKLQRENIVEIIMDVFVAFFVEFERRGITPVIDLPDEPLYVRCDRGSVERILNNLIQNAVKYGAEGKVIGVNIEQADKLCWIGIWDKGEGIMEKDLPHVFNRLFQAEKSRSNAGNGLGLSITKKLVEKQHGQIHVTSKPYERTCFSFSLMAEEQM